MTSGYEKRRFNRSTVEIPVTLDFGQGQTKAGKLSNLSMVGMYVVADDPAPVDTDCDASLALDPPAGAVSVRGRVMHQDKAGMGIEIIGIEDASFQGLRTLIVDHAEDPFDSETQIITNMSLIPPLY